MNETAEQKILTNSPDKGKLKGVASLDKVDKSFCYIPYNHKLVEKARENRKNPTTAEKKIWYKILRNRQFRDFKFIRQKPLDKFIADFYCAELMMVIEINGDSHTRQEEYDLLRTEELEKYGIKVIRYSNNEVMFNLDGIYEDLKNKIEERNKFWRGA